MACSPLTVDALMAGPWASADVALRVYIAPYPSSGPQAAPPAKKARTVGWWVGPLGITLTRRGVRRLMAIQSSTVGRRRPAAWAMAGMCATPRRKIVHRLAIFYPPYRFVTSTFEGGDSVDDTRRFDKTNRVGLCNASGPLGIDLPWHLGNPSARPTTSASGSPTKTTRSSC